MSGRVWTVEGAHPSMRMSALALENVYTYRHLDTGRLHYTRGRYRRRDGGKEFFFWEWSDAEDRPVICSGKTGNEARPHLYNLDSLLLSEQDKIVFVVEGEKCVEALSGHGILAVTHAGGANGWKAEYAPFFEGRLVAILPDFDPGGMKLAETIEASVQPHAAAVVTVPPDAYDGTIARWMDTPEPEEDPSADHSLEAAQRQNAAVKAWWLGVKGRDVADWLSEGDAENKVRRLELQAIRALRLALRRPRPRPKITVTPRLDQVVDAAVSVLEGADAGLYLRGGRVVRVNRGAAPRPWRKASAPVIEIVSPANLRDRLSRATDFIKQSGEKETVIPPPAWAGEMLLDREGLPFHPLEGISECPTMRPDGSILQTPGYDAASGVIYEPTAEFPLVPEEPDDAQLAHALDLLRDVFHDFPFLAQSDQAAAHAALFSVVARPAYPGPAPAFVVRAPTPGTGKSLLADVTSLIATGREQARMGMPASDEEMRKSIVAIALDGSAIVLLDNERGDLGSKELARAITAEHVTDRLLGVSRKVTMPMRAVWFATGNNLTFSADLARRVIPIDLDAKLENPEDRHEFRHPDLKGYVLEARPQLVVAALTVLRAYHVAGRPTYGKNRIGSFEGWDDLIRGACVWAGLGDPEGGRERVRADDVDTDALAGALDALEEEFGGSSFTAAEAARKYANGSEQLKGAIAEWVSGKGIVDARSIGNAFTEQGPDRRGADVREGRGGLRQADSSLEGEVDDGDDVLR